MHLFWRAVDSKYYDPCAQVPPSPAPAGQSPASQMLPKTGSMAGTKRPATETLALVARLLRPQAFRDPANPAAAANKFGLFCLQLENSLQSYGFLFKIVGKGKLPCEWCVLKVQQRFLQTWSDSPVPVPRQSPASKLLEQQATHLSQLSPLSFCSRCLFASGAPQEKHDAAKYDCISDLQTQNRTRIQELLRLSEARRQQSRCLAPHHTAFQQVELQKQYIQRVLVELEKKILAEAIIKVSHAKKNQRVEIWLGKPSIRVNVRLDDLLKMDHLRENSLFRVSKTTLKCQTPYCSYNVASPALRRHAAPETPQHVRGLRQDAAREVPGQVHSPESRPTRPGSPS